MATEKLLTIGLDIGTSTTQLILSELTIENFASMFTVPRITITDKKVIYKSDIIFTPLLSDDVIDEEQIKSFVKLQYEKANISKQNIQMGAVIITGETARKSNANNVLQALSGYAGDFVVATAGPDLESIIAGKGGCADVYSKEKHAVVANIDIGGGTSNLVVFKDGEVVDTACFDIGGRLIKIDKETEKITYITPKLRKIIDKENLQLKVAEKVDKKSLERIIEILTITLEHSIGIKDNYLEPEYFDLLVTNHGLNKNHPIDYITFTGGVADCITNEERPIFSYGDIGILLGKAIYNSLLTSSCKVLPTSETIRATVVGAGSHTTEVSGSTIAYSENILPLKNLPILKMAKVDEQGTADDLANSIKEKLEWFNVNDERQNIALALHGIKSPSFQDIQRYAKGVVEGLESETKKGSPLIIIVEEDMAKALGHAIYALIEKDKPFVCIDTIRVENGDFIDLGMPIAGGTVLPVVVKTLVFN